MSKLLVIEDSPTIALLLRRRLEMAGHEVTTTSNGRNGLLRLQRNELPDLVLADVLMPRTDGIETLQRIKSGHPGLPVVLVTGQDVDASSRKLADAVFAKPIDFDRLLKAVEKLVSRDFDADA